MNRSLLACRSLALAFLFLLGGISASGQTTLYIQNFGTTTDFSAGWGTSTGSGEWVISTTSASNSYSGASGQSNALNTHTAGGTRTNTLTFNGVSTIGFTNITVLWGANRTSSNSATLQYSINGTTWVPVSFTDVSNNGTWQLVNGGVRIALPTSANNVSNLQLRWIHTVGSSQVYRIDDVTIQGTAACTTPTAYSVTGGGAYCSGGLGVAVGLDDSETGVTYQLYRNVSTAVGSAVAGTGNAISFGNQTVAGTYTVEATRTTGGCTNDMNGSVLVTITPNVTAGTVSGTSPVCIGATPTYSSNGTAGGTWSSTNEAVATVNASTGVVTALSGGSTDITYTVNSGCGSPVSSFATLTVNANVTAGTVSGTSPVCIGATPTYSSNGTAGGTWSSTNEAVATVNASTGVVTALSGGSTDITYTVNSGCGSPVSSFATLTVNANVTAGTVSGTSPVCIGATPTYSSNGTAGGTWSSTIEAVATVNASTGVVTAISGGSTDITYTVNSGCGSPVSSFATLTVNANITAGTVSGTSPVCIGATPIYSSDGTAGGTWSSTNEAIATVNASTGVVTAISGGSTDITYTVNSGCGSPVSSFASLTVNADVVPGTVSGSSPLCVGSSAVYTTNGTPGGTWSSSNNLVATVDPSTGEVTAANAGNANIIYTVTTGCGSPVSAFASLTVNGLPNNTGSGFGNGTVCLGEQGYLSYDAVNAGFFSPHTITYTNGNQNFQAVINTFDPTQFNVTATINTDYTLVSIEDGNGCIRTSGFGDGAASVNFRPLPLDKTISAASAVICPGTSTNIQVLSSENGISYQLRNNADDSPVGSPVTGNGGTISLSTGILNGSYTFNVLATRTTANPTTECIRELSATVTVDAVDNIDPTVLTQAVTIYLDATGAASVTAAQVNNGSTDNCTIATMTLDKTAFDCSEVGPNTVTLTVTDVNGNDASATATVTVVDNIDPTVITQAVTIYLDATGAATVTAAQVNNGSTDNCTIATMTLDKTAFDCSEVGPNTVTLTVTDVNGNDASATATVTVVDNIDPTVITQAVTIYLDATGAASVTAAQVNNGSTDNCTIATMTLDKTDFDCSEVGPNTVTLTVTDVNGNDASATATVTVVDNIDPTVLTQAVTIYLDATGAASVTAAQVNNGSTDNCTIATMTLDKTDFDCSEVGPNTVTLTVTDVNGNDASATATVTVVDNIDPTVLTQPVTIYLDATGAASVTAAQVNNGSTDNCTIATMTLDKTDFDCSEVGPNTVTLTVTDVNGNDASATATVTVVDNIDPTVLTQAVTIYLDATGAASVTAAQVNNGSTDNCTIATMTLDKTAFDCSEVGPNTVTLTVTDVNGNDASATATVTVVDNIDPTVITQAVTIYLDATGAASVTAAQVNNGSTDNCTIATMTLDKTAFDCSEVGPNTVTLTVTDVNGNDASATATVTVVDNIDPTVITQAVTIYLDATGAATVTAAQVNNGSTDNCTIATMTLDKTAFDCSEVGPNTVTLTVTDVNGNDASATATVTVVDNIDPTVITQAVTIYLDATGAASVTAAQVNNGSTDNCTIATMTLDKTDFDCSEVGPNTVTLTVTDVNGNDASATATVTVVDNIDPTVLTQPVTIYLDATGAASVTAAQVNNGSTDNCTIATMTLDKTDFDCSEVGPNTVTLTVTDVNGNDASATATVTVVDNIDPTVLTQAVTIYLDATGAASVTAAQVNNGSTDNCTIATMTLDKTAFDCSEVGPNTVTLTVTDVNGNDASATATVTVVDNIDPTVITQAVTIYLDATGAASVTAAQVNNGSTDNCTIATMTLDKTAFDCSEVGPNTVTLTVTDVNGNDASATATVTVVDNIDPTVITQAVTIYLDATGAASVTAAQVNNGSTDNCTIATMTLDKTAFDCSEVGPNTVTLTVTDVNGNDASATATVTVVDNIDPTVLTQAVTIYLDATGAASVTAAQVNNGSTDNCTIATMTLDKTDFDCSEVGPNTVTLTVTDVNGNDASATATVTVVDNIDPTVLTQAVTIYLDATGAASVTAAQVNNGSTDNCTIATMTLDKTDFDCSEVGPNTVTLTVTDVNGNDASATATVTVVDNIDPTVLTQPVTIYLDATGAASVTAAQVNNGSTDNCTIATMTLDKTAFDCSEVGPNTVTLTVTDVNGNDASATATVTVVDNIDPTVLTQAVTIYLDATGAASVTAAQVNNGSTDNCTIATMTLDKTAFDCSEVGPNTVTLTVTDVNGNDASATATVTVVDNIDPTVITQAVTIYLDATGAATVTAAQVNNGSTDNCTIATMTLDKTAFDCSEVGPNTVTLTVTDVNGNDASATATVTVVDNIDPTVITQAVTIYLDATGAASVTAAQVNNGSTDNCTIATMTLDKTAFDCSEVGPNTVTLTVTDVNGNDASATATVTVVDNIDPTVLTQAVTIYLDATGAASVTAAQVNNGSTDNCTIATMTLDKTDFDCSEVGPNTVTLTVTDVNGNDASATATVTVVDNIDPTVLTQPVTIYLDATGAASVTAAQVNNGSTDNCTIATMTLDKTDFDCSEVGPNTVTLTVTDVNGNDASATATVTVVDNIDPIIISCPAPITVYTGINNTLCSQTVSWIEPTAMDNCSESISYSYRSHAPGSVFPVGNTTVKYEFTDVNNNKSNCEFTVSVIDNTVPVITTGIIGDCYPTAQDAKTAALAATSATDNCPGTITYTASITGDCNAVVTVTAKDVAGNESSTTYNTRVDNTKPVFTSSIANGNTYNVNYDPANCGAIVNYTISALDNCSGSVTPVLTAGLASGSVFLLGTTLVTHTATDDCGNVETRSFTIMVNPAPTTSTLTVKETTTQYSDTVRLKVVITNGASLCGGTNAALTATFTIAGVNGSQVMKHPVTGITNIPFIVNGNDLEAILTTPLLDYVDAFANGKMKPGAKTVSAVINGIASEFAVSQPSNKALTVTQEDAIIVYNGDIIKAAPSSSATSVTFDLRATIFDINYPQVPANPLFDQYPGDIRNAKVRFTNADGETGVTINSDWFPVSTLVGSDKRVGVVSISGGLTITGLSNNSPSKQVRIGIEVNHDGYYYALDDIIVTAYLPNGDFITGGGYIIPTESVGRKASDDNRKVNFGFNVKFNKTGKNLQGNMNIVFRRLENDGRVHAYQLKANAMISLGVNASNPNRQTAEYVSKVSVKDLISSTNTSDADLGGNKYLYVKMIDNGEPGINDSISFVLVNGTDDPNVLSNIIWSSNWVGSLTQMMNLGGGNLVVHSGFNLGNIATGLNPESIIAVTEQQLIVHQLVIKAFPNPSEQFFNLNVQSGSQETVDLKVFDMHGRVVYTTRGSANQSYRFGDKFIAGVYMVEVKQGDKRSIIQLVKQ